MQTKQTTTTNRADHNDDDDDDEEEDDDDEDENDDDDEENGSESEDIRAEPDSAPKQPNWKVPKFEVSFDCANDGRIATKQF